MTKKQQTNSIKAAAVLLCMPVEKLEELIDMQITLSVCQNEKRQIGEMYNKLFEADAERIKVGNELAAKFLVTPCGMKYKEFVTNWEIAVRK